MASAANVLATPKLGLAQILSADASNPKTVLTGPSAGTKITGIVASSDDTSARNIIVQVNRSGTRYILGTVPVAIGAGTNGTTPAQDLLSSAWIPGLPVDNDGQRYLFLESGDLLEVKSTTTVTSAKTVSVLAVAAEF